MICVIAGAGQLPILAVRKILFERGNCPVVSLYPESNGEQLSEITKPVLLLKNFSSEKVLKFFSENKVSEVLLVGKVEKKEIFRVALSDKTLRSILWRKIWKNDHELHEMVTDFLEKRGISVVGQAKFFESFRIPRGTIGTELDGRSKLQLERGLRVADKLSELGIGQTIVIKDGMVVAVEAAEGTDATIRRAIELVGEGLTVIKGFGQKVKRSTDIPVIGVGMLDGIRPGEIETIAWHHERAIILNPDQFIDKAQKLKIRLVAV